MTSRAQLEILLPCLLFGVVYSVLHFFVVLAEHFGVSCGVLSLTVNQAPCRILGPRSFQVLLDSRGCTYRDDVVSKILIFVYMYRRLNVTRGE